MWPRFWSVDDAPRADALGARHSQETEAAGDEPVDRFVHRRACLGGVL